MRSVLEQFYIFASVYISSKLSLSLLHLRLCSQRSLHA